VTRLVLLVLPANQDPAPIFVIN